MLEILQFYVSGFWVWLGLTCGLYVVIIGGAMLLSSVLSAIVGRK
jgi:hypothetical protein